ncbi:hypothetical protein ACFC4S_30495 [Priestia megaterium]|uniref:hypothetical protein n=1 Tax=Priestia megaterium TaxID=1404 RepID=UPI0035DA2980
MKKYILLTVAACAVLTGCNASYKIEGSFKQSVVNSNSEVTFKTNKITSDQEIAVFHLKANKNKTISIPYTVKGLDNEKLSLKVGKRISETTTYDEDELVDSSTHTFVYEKELDKSQKGEIHFVAKKSGNYAIIVGNGNQDEETSDVKEDIEFTAKLPK